MKQNGKQGKRGFVSASDGNKIRVRGRRLDEIDSTKLTLAYWLLAKRLVADKTEPRLPTEAEVLRDLDSGGNKNDTPEATS